MTKNELQKLIDNFNIDKYVELNPSIQLHESDLASALIPYQKKDYELLFAELNVVNGLHNYTPNSISYSLSNAVKDIVYILSSYSDNGFDEIVRCNLNDLEGIRNTVEFLRSRR